MRHIKSLIAGLIEHYIITVVGTVMTLLGITDWFWDQWWNPPDFVLSAWFRPALIVVGIGVISWSFARKKTTEQTVISDTSETTVSKVRRDVSLRDAVFYCVFKDWIAKTIDEVGEEDKKTIQRIYDSADLLRQAALDGEITIWGRSGFSGPLVEIPKEYWEHYDFKIFWFFKESPDEWVTEKINKRQQSDHLVYKELMTSKKQVMELVQAKLAQNETLPVGECSKDIGYLFQDIIEAKRIDPIERKMPDMSEPRSYSAYWKLENLAATFCLQEQTREKLKEFLGFFDVKHKTFNGLPMNSSIRANFESLSELDAKIEYIKKLSLELTKELP